MHNKIVANGHFFLAIIAGTARVGDLIYITPYHPLLYQLSTTLLAVVTEELPHRSFNCTVCRGHSDGVLSYNPH